MQRPDPGSRCVGFTLMEMIVVIVIIAIAAGMAIPYVTDTNDIAVLAAAKTIASDLRYAQNLAITTQQRITIAFDTCEESYTVSNASDTLIHPIKKAAYEVDFSSMRGFENLNIVSADFGGASTITFDALGAPDNAGTLNISTSSDNICVITVASATGKVTVSAAGS